MLSFFGVMLISLDSFRNFSSFVGFEHHARMFK